MEYGNNGQGEDTAFAFEGDWREFAKIALPNLLLTIVTLGFFYLVVNGAMLYLAAALTPGLELAGFGSAILGAVVISIVGMLLGGLVRDED